MRIVVAMSGGVDSSVAAALYKAEGYDVIGMTMNVWDSGDFHPASQGKTCCSLTDIQDARRVCDKLDIPFYPLNFRDQFYKEVFLPFVEAYRSGRTPNPCVLCNSVLKFRLLLERADALEADLLATGHYARIVQNPNSGMAQLFRGIDRAKDQSYFLFGLKRGVIERIRFPLGDKSKPEVRDLAKKLGLANAEKRDSQDVCFVKEGSFGDLLAQNSGLSNIGQGEIVDKQGRVLGKHDGYYRYTIGQRRGLGVASTGRIYVVGIDPAMNRVILGSEDDLLSSELIAEQLSFVAEDGLEEGREILCQIRSRHNAAKARAYSMDSTGITTGGRMRVVFEQPQSAITPGQAAVFYNGDEVLGGGWIAGGTEWKS